VTRFLAPYIWPLIGALFFALIAAGGYIYVQGQWLDQAEAERDALQGRIDNINTSREIENAIRSLDHTDFGSDIDGRLSGDDP
jgi:hypothetical protein